MRKIVLVDNNESFRNVVELNMMINEDTDLELVDILSDVDLLNSSVEQYTPDIILISDNVIEQFHMRAYGGAKIYGYETGDHHLRSYIHRLRQPEMQNRLQLSVLPELVLVPFSQNML